MTRVLDAPALVGDAQRRKTDAAATPGASAWARWRVTSRLARRQLRRAWVSSLLVTTLVALPIAVMTAFLVYSASMIGTPAEKTTAELGRMQAWIAPVGVPGEGFWQAPTEPEWNGYPIADDGSMSVPEGAPVDDPTALLPAGTDTVVLSSGNAAVRTPDGATVLRAWAGPAWHPRFAGAFDPVDGERPDSSREAMVTPAALDRLGVEIGGTLRLDETDDEFTIVGTLDASALPDREPAVFLPTSQSDLVGGEVRWYLPERALSWADVQRLNEDGVVAYSRAVVANPPAYTNEWVQSAATDWWSTIWPLVLMLSVAALFAGYVVVMLAGAAFAVAARRQQRALAVAASVGADRRDLSRTILLQGATLGLVGGTVGVLAGLGLAAAVVALAHDGSATQFWGFHVPWPVLAGILVFAVVVGTASAYMPARTVGRSDALQALRGSRRPQRPAASRPVWGSITIVVGVALTILSAFSVAWINTTDAFGYDSPMRYVPAYGIVVGPILAQFGMLMSGRWLLWLSSRGLSHVGIGAKLASRDAAANASRTVPAFAAIAATVFIGVFALGVSSMQTAQTARHWFYDAPLGSIAISLWPGSASTTGILTAEDAETAADAAVSLARDAGGVDPAVLARQMSTIWAYSSADEIPDEVTFTLAVLPERHLLDPTVEESFSSFGQDPSNPLSVIAPSDVRAAIGVELSASDLTAYRDGAALVADPRFATDGTIDVETYAGADVYRGMVPDNIWARRADAPEVADPVRSERIDAIVVDAPRQPVMIAISPGTAQRLGMAPQPERVVASVGAALTTQTRDRMQSQAQMLSGSAFTLAPSVVEGPPSDAAWMIPLLGAVAVLVLGASAVALGLARFERRPDDATLAAVGATPSLRRRIGFWQGLIIAGLGTIAGAAAGILPPIGFAIQSAGAQQLADIPWWLIGAVAVALPLAIAVVSWLVPPRHPDLTRRTAIT